MSEVTPDPFSLMTPPQVVDTPARSPSEKKMLVFAGWIILFSSTAANVGLVVANRSLATKVERLRSQQIAPKNFALPPLSGLDQSGKPAVVDFKNQTHPTVLFVFSPTCPVCTRNWPRWNSILASQHSLNWRPIFVNMGKSMTAQYLDSHGLQQYTTFAQVSTNTALTYKLYFTPETIILDNHGKVTNEWVGELSPDVVRDFSQSLLNSE